MRRQIRLAHQPGDTHHGVQRGANLMAHRRHELGPQPGGRLRRIACCRQGQFVLPALGDIGIGPHRPPIRQQPRLYLQHPPAGPLAFVGRWPAQPAGARHGIHIDIAAIRHELAAIDLPLQDVAERHAGVGEPFRQVQQFRRPPVDHRDPPLHIHHQDALAHVLQRGAQRCLGCHQPLAGADEHLPQRHHKPGKPQPHQQEPDRFLLELAEYLARRQPDQHRQPVAVQPPERVEPFGRIDRTGAPPRAGLHRPAQLIHGGRRHRRPERTLHFRCPRPEHPVQPHQRDRTPWRVEGGVEAREIGGIQGDHDHAGHCPMGIEQLARELDRPFAGDAAEHRLADEQEILRRPCQVHANMLAVRQIHRRPAEVARLQHAARIGQRDLQREVVQHLVARGQRLDVEPRGIGAIKGAQHGEHLVHRLQRARHALAEATREVGGGLEGFHLHPLALVRQVAQHAGPHHEQGQQRYQRFQPQPAAVPRDHRSRFHLRWGRRCAACVHARHPSVAALLPRFPRWNGA